MPRLPFISLLAVVSFPIAHRAPQAAESPSSTGKFFGCIWNNAWSSPTSPSENFRRTFNQITPESVGKWGMCEPVRGKYSWGTLDAMYAFAKTNKYIVKQHAFIWGQNQPKWLSEIKDPAVMRETVSKWIKAYSNRYRDRVHLIDVVNEPLHAPPSFRDALGGSGKTGWDWVIWSFEQARAAAPGVPLILNDYDILKSDGNTTKFLAIIKILKDRKLIDAIGEQCHNLRPVTWKRMGKRMLMIFLVERKVQVERNERNQRRPPWLR